MRNLSAFFWVITFICYGCASIVSKSDYPVSFNTTPSGAIVKIYDVKKGVEVYSGTTPTTVTLKAKAGFFSPAKYNVDFLFSNGIKKNITLTASIDGWYIGNLLFGGVIGMLIVDPATGAMWKLPSAIKMNLSSDLSIISNGKRLSIAMLNSVPENLRMKMIPIRF